jgi:hypothetical protein
MHSGIHRALGGGLLSEVVMAEEGDDETESDFYKIDKSIEERFLKLNSETSFKPTFTVDDVVRLFLAHEQLLVGIREITVGLMDLHENEVDWEKTLREGMQSLKESNNSYRVVIERLMRQALGE